jgi:pimeloyl-ACP methyl ester carboxylesterase
MDHQETLVVGGVDAHADSHHAAAVDERGVLLGSGGFATTADGYGELFRWLSSFGRLAVVGVESSGSSAAGLVRYLRSQGVRVLEVNEPHARARRRLGKSDPIDAELAARVALAGKANAIPKQTEGIVESLRQLRVARQSAVKARSAAMVQLQDLTVTAPEPLREQLSCRKTIRGKASLCRRLRPAISEVERPSQEAWNEYLRCISDPSAIHAMCEDYRAGASIDLEHDRSDLVRKIACPLLVLWGGKNPIWERFDMLDIWRQRAETVTGEALPCGHYLLEEAPDATYARLHAFFSDPPAGPDD